MRLYIACDKALYTNHYNPSAHISMVSFVVVVSIIYLYIESLYPNCQTLFECMSNYCRGLIVGMQSSNIKHNTKLQLKCNKIELHNEW